MIIEIEQGKNYSGVTKESEEIYNHCLDKVYSPELLYMRS